MRLPSVVFPANRAAREIPPVYRLKPVGKSLLGHSGEIAVSRGFSMTFTFPTKRTGQTCRTKCPALPAQTARNDRNSKSSRTFRNSFLMTFHPRRYNLEADLDRRTAPFIPSIGVDPLGEEKFFRGLVVFPMKIRVGLVGLGDAWEKRHRPALRAWATASRSVAVYDQVRHRADLVAHEFDAAAVDGFRALTQREDIDAVLILASQWFASAADPGRLRLGQGGLLRRRPGSRRRASRADQAAGARSRASPSWPSFPAGRPRPPCG